MIPSSNTGSEATLHTETKEETHTPKRQTGTGESRVIQRGLRESSIERGTVEVWQAGRQDACMGGEEEGGRWEDEKRGRGSSSDIDKNAPEPGGSEVRERDRSGGWPRMARGGEGRGGNGEGRRRGARVGETDEGVVGCPARASAVVHGFKGRCANSPPRSIRDSGEGRGAEEPKGVPCEEGGGKTSTDDLGADSKGRRAIPEGVRAGMGDTGVGGAAWAYPRVDVGTGSGIDRCPPEGLFEKVGDGRGPEGREGSEEGGEGKGSEDGEEGWEGGLHG